MAGPENPGRGPATRDWDDAYANMAHIPGAEALPARWARDAAAFRAGQRVERLSYGDHSREIIDVVRPDGASRGLAVFVHGGYWMRTDPSSWSHLADGALARGWTVALPGYVLTPEVRLTEITAQIARAIDAMAARVPGPIRLAGHSAGGHLVARMACDDRALSPATAARVEHVLSLSGLHDLRPLIWTALNDTLRLDELEARAESPALHRPAPGTRLTAWVGGGERPEFLRQARLIDVMWSGLQARTRVVIDGLADHFSVLDGLRDPGHPLTEAFVGDLPEGLR